ncbi:imidazole glycerol phosphate synthase subunit HisF [Fulvivirga sp. M361]|uniref:AglZ/HisF2 family acetamidino modification protein n=1 Tax=Fulvivirga sp. M361 TaxID=2594266 RepID=UPI00117B0084|nr:AglZ/HisF2 family acetamidino modification protein [Fulvivirga sp. M361]TRX50221.1 imidazole glycerol phosphate synthase subunit HisF [Fulvivirga sp. M361]
MRRIRVIPILLLSNGGLVKTARFKKPNYIGDPINAVRIFNDKEVDELALLDIEASGLGKEPNFEKIKNVVSEAFMPMAYGGGIKTLDHIKSIFRVGIEKVVINTMAGRDPGLLERGAAIYGSQSIAVSMDVKKDFLGKYRVYLNKGKEKVRLSPVEYAKRAESFGAGEIIITSIDREGTYLGYDLDLVNQVSAAIQIPLVVNGGARNINDFLIAAQAGASATAAGSLFVYSSDEKGVMINYPKQHELTDHLYSKLN